MMSLCPYIPCVPISRWCPYFPPSTEWQETKRLLSKAISDRKHVFAFVKGSPVFLRAPGRAEVAALLQGLGCPGPRGGLRGVVLGLLDHGPPSALAVLSWGTLSVLVYPATEVLWIAVWEGPSPRGGSSLARLTESWVLCHPVLSSTWHCGAPPQLAWPAYSLPSGWWGIRCRLPSVPCPALSAGVSGCGSPKWSFLWNSEVCFAVGAHGDPAHQPPRLAASQGSLVLGGDAADTLTWHVCSASARCSSRDLGSHPCKKLRAARRCLQLRSAAPRVRPRQLSGMEQPTVQAGGIAAQSRYRIGTPLRRIKADSVVLFETC